MSQLSTRLLLCVLLGLPYAEAAKLTVFAAASLTDAFSEIGKNFDARSGNTTTFQFAGSQALRTQLEQGAKADVFASANAAQYEPLQQAGMLTAPQPFARNRLVVIAPKTSSKVKTLADLALPNVKLVLADKNVPVGDYTRKTLALISKAGTYGPDFAARVLGNAVSEEPNVRQVAVKIQLGQGDAAIVYASDVTPSLRPDVRTIGLPNRFNPLASYPIGILKKGNTVEGQAFVDYVVSADGQKTLKKWGFVGAK